MSYNPYYMRTPATGQLEPLIPNLGQEMAQGVQSGVQMQEAPYMIQQEQAKASAMNTEAQAEKLKTLLSFAGPASYGILTAEDKDKPALYQQFRTQVTSMFPQLGQSLPNEWNDQAEKYTTQTYQESQQVKDLMLRNIIAQQTGAHGVDLSHVLPATEAAQQAGAIGAQGQIPGQSPVGADWLGLAGSAMFGGGTGFEMARAAVEPSIQGTRSQYDLVDLWDPKSQSYVKVPRSSVLGLPGVGGQPSPHVPPNVPPLPGAQGGQTTPNVAPAPSPDNPFIPVGGAMPTPQIMGANIGKLGPGVEDQMKEAAQNAYKWKAGIDSEVTQSQSIQASLDDADQALAHFNPSAFEPTKVALQKVMNYVDPSYHGELDSITQFNKSMLDVTVRRVRQTSSRAAYQEVQLIQKAFPNIGMPDREAAQFLTNVVRATNVDMPQLAQKYAAEWMGHHNGSLIGAQENWNAYSNPFAIALMRLPQDEATKIMASVAKNVPGGRAMVANWRNAFHFYQAAGLADRIMGPPENGGQ